MLVVGTNMKKFLFLLLVSITTISAQQNPAYRSFNTNHFNTNQPPAQTWPISINSNLSLSSLTITNNLIVQNDIYVSNSIVVQGVVLDPQSLWIPTLAYEAWYDPFNGSALTDGTAGSLGWTDVSAGAGGGNTAVSNAVGHFGTIANTTSTSSNSIQYLHLSSSLSGKPCIPPLNNFAGWTNRIVWRINVTNDCRAWFIFQAGTFTSTLTHSNAIGIFVDTGTTDQIMGFTSDAVVSSTTTNLGTLQSTVWNTNYIWCDTAGVISFSLNNGPRATINTTLPTSGLTPAMGIVKTAAANAVSQEIDDWLLWVKR